MFYTFKLYWFRGSLQYARSLVDDIAPFTIITNGQTTRIFDSISKIELTGQKISEQSSFWKNGYTLSTDDELRIRYEALKNFVSFSSENLKLFCKNQVQDRMGPVIGTIDTPSSKFIKELYCQRQDLLTSFNNFVSSEAKVFSIVGSAGVGKTNAICSLALQNIEDKFVFFYNASLINKSPLEHITQDLNSVFSSKSDSDLVLKKLDELGRFLNKDVLIFIDAIDESINPGISLELSEIALACRNLSNIKFCISCKSNIWDNILKINGTPSHLYEELNKYPEITNNPRNKIGFLLENFTDEELENIIPIYKNVFGFKGEISKALLKELRNGFFLRIFSEVYSHKQIPDKINDKELIKTYIRQSLEKTDIGVQTGLRILSEIGKVLLDHNYTSLEAFKDEGLDVNNILTKLNFSVNVNLPEDLFARNILIKSNKEDSYNVTFYYSKIRDYIICFHSYALDKLDDTQFYNLLEKFYQNYIGQSAIEFYIENASTSHRYTLTKFKKDKALQYVTNYNSYLDEIFKNFKKEFDPYSNGSIGIVLPENLINEDGYGLFPLKDNLSNRVHYEFLGDGFSNDINEDLIYKKGVRTIYGSNRSLMVVDQEKVVRQNIFKQLKEIIKKGKLTTYDSDVLLLEQTSTIFYYYHKQLRYDLELHDYYLPRFESIYPIDLKELRNKLYRFRASAHYRYRERLSSDLIELKVEEAFRANLDIPGITTIGDVPPFEELFKIVNILLERGYSEIKNHHLPCPDKSLIETKKYYEQNRSQDLAKVRIFQYSEDQAKLYIESFFKHLESAYQKFVEYNFPTLKSEFPFYTNCPHEYFFYMKDSDILKWGRFGYCPSKCDNVKIYLSNNTSKQAFEEDGVSILQGFSLDRILHNDYHDRIKTIDKINTSKVDEFCVIRNWIYKLLKSDMEKLFKENED